MNDSAGWTIGEITGWRPRVRGHDGKTVFKSRGAAEAAIRALRRRGEREYGAALRDGESLNVYACQEGGVLHWHTGHSRGEISC